MTLHQSEWLVSKGQERTSFDEDVEKREPLCLAGENVDWCSHCGNSMEVPQKTWNRSTIWSSNSISGYLSKESENTNLKRYMHPYVCCNIIYNSQDMKATWIHRLMNGWRYVYRYTMKLLLSHGKEWNVAICISLDGPRGYYTKCTKWEKDKYHMISKNKTSKQQKRIKKINWWLPEERGVKG